MKNFFTNKFLQLAKLIYYRIPLSASFKWRLRAACDPIFKAFISAGIENVSFRSICDGIFSRNKRQNGAIDFEVESALGRILNEMEKHSLRFGIPNFWISLPFIGSGGAERVALNFISAVRELRPNQSVVLLVTDRELVSVGYELPSYVLLIVFDRYLTSRPSLYQKQALLRNLLVAVQPHVFHVVNSEVSWQLIASEGQRLKRYVHLFGSIFAFQYAPSSQKKIGYAASFLPSCLPHLTGLLSDNNRFISDAITEYGLDGTEISRLKVLYQPCRLFDTDAYRNYTKNRLDFFKKMSLTTPNSSCGRRPQVLWAGRLDEEKRLDLFFEVARRCEFADFRVYGQAVLDISKNFPDLSNLSYEGPFESPLEWLESYTFDAFLFTSRWEGMPNILLEVGALGIPVIAPTVGGVGELISGSTGFPLPEQPSVSDYEAALHQVISDPIQALARAQKLLELVRERHSWQSFIKCFTELPGYLPVIDLCDDTEVNTKHLSSPLVSVVIPCFNQGRYLQQSVSSALLATSRPLEIIIVDDGSTDVSIDLDLEQVARLAPQSIRIYRQANQGLSSARNKGLKHARGKYVQFLDADDLLIPSKIDIQISHLEISPKLDVSICNYFLCDESCENFTKSEESISHFELSDQDFLFKWERGFAIPIHAGLFRAKSIQNNQFDEQLLAKEDWVFWTSLSLSGKQFGYVEGHWVVYRQHVSSMRHAYVSMGKFWLQAGLTINGLLKDREPLFLDSVFRWFEQYYRSHPMYKVEIERYRELRMHQVTSGSSDPSKLQMESVAQVKRVSTNIKNVLAALPAVTRHPMFTLVVPVFERFDYLEKCLCSLAEQGKVDFNVICIDDGSSDPRVGLLINELKNCSSQFICLRNSSNQGISTVLNAAVQMAIGEYIVFLDCDDALQPNALARVRRVLVEKPDIDYLFTDRLEIDSRNRFIRLARYGGYQRIRFRSQENISDDLIDGMVASHLKVIRRSVFLEVGGCDQEFSGIQDWELALRISRHYKLYYLNEPLYLHRVHEGSVTTTDRQGQHRKTNIVLRQYLVSLRGSVDFLKSTHIFGPKDLPVSPKYLRTLWKVGKVCIVDFRGEVSLEQINFIREFNAYFDQILWSQPHVPVSLIGFLWSNSLLVKMNDQEQPIVF